MVNCEKCGRMMLQKHDDTDRMNISITWFRCVCGHWQFVPKKETE